MYMRGPLSLYFDMHEGDSIETCSNVKLVEYNYQEKTGQVICFYKGK